MGAGVLYANANIIMQGDAFLLTRERIRKMVATDDREEILKVLAECGYHTDLASDDEILETERQKTLKTFVELCDDEALITCVKALHQATETNYLDAFTTLADTVPRIKCATIRQYFTTLADLTNVRTFYKGGKTLVPGGTLSASELNIFADTEMNSEQIETEIQRRLDEIAAQDKDDIFKPNPLFWWYTQKQKELITVKTILMCKRFHYDTMTIRENLRGLYGQFK